MMQSTQTKQVRADRSGTSPKGRPTVVAYDPYFPQVSANRGAAPDVAPADGTSLVFNPYFPKLARAAV
jgi:hypothetical protein